METLNIQIRSREQLDAEFIKAWKAAESGKHVIPTKGTYFTSLEAVRAILTEKRLGLLHLIREHHPRSINALAKLAGRNFKNVRADVMLLQRCGLLRLGRREGRSSRPEVSYRHISIHTSV